MSDPAQQDSPLLNPAMATHASIPESEENMLHKVEGMARQTHLYGRSRWVCALYFIWETLSHLSALVTFLRWLASPLLGPTTNPIVSALNNSTPSGFCVAPPDSSWCAVCVDTKVDGQASSARSRDRCSHVSLLWIDSSLDLSVKVSKSIEIAAFVGDRILGAASCDGTLLLCCGSSGRASLFSIGQQGESIELDLPAGPWNGDAGGCAILSTGSKSAICNHLVVCDAYGRFFVASTFQLDSDSTKASARFEWRWHACKSRSNLKIVHFLSQISDSSFIVGGLGHANLCGALEIYDAVMDKSLEMSSSCRVEVVLKHSSLKNALPHSMCVSASSGPRGILASFNDGSIAMLSPSPEHSVERIWSHDVFPASADNSRTVENPFFAAWMHKVVRVGWWTENKIVVIRRNGRCSVHSAIINDRAMRFLGPVQISSPSTVAIEAETVSFLPGMPSAIYFSQGIFQGNVLSVSASISPSKCVEAFLLKASDIQTVFSSLTKRCHDFAVQSCDVNMRPFSGARDFYLKFQHSCVPSLSLDSLLVAEFVSSKEPLEQRVLLLPQMSSAVVIERAVRLLTCSLPELIFHLETTILDIDIVRSDELVSSELLNTLFWARIFAVPGREGIDFIELIKQSTTALWNHLKVLDESTFPRSYRDCICKRLVRDEVADMVLALMICDAPLFDKFALVDDIVFYFWNFCAASYPEVCQHMCVFEDTSAFINLLPSVEGCPLRIYEKRRISSSPDSKHPGDDSRWSSIGFSDRTAVVSWFRRRVNSIELETGNIGNVRELLEVAVSRCNLKELTSDLDDVCDLHGFLYSVPIRNISAEDANLDSFKLYTPAQRLWRVLSSFPLEEVSSAIVGVGRELVDRHNMPYSSFLDCVQHWAFDRSVADLYSPRRNPVPHTGAAEHYKYDFLFAATALESLNDPSIDVLSWDESGEVIVDLVFDVCMRSSSDDEELEAVDRLLILYKNLTGFSSQESRQSALEKLGVVDVVRSAAEVCRYRGVDPADSIGENWNLNMLRAKQGDSTIFDAMCNKIVEFAVCSDDFETSDPDLLRRDLSTLARLFYGSPSADEVIGPVFLGALMQLRLWDKALEFAKSVVIVSKKELIFRSFQVCMSNAILHFENPTMTLADCVLNAELCIKMAKDLIVSPFLDSSSDEETTKIAEYHEIIQKQETLHRIASLMEDCGLENVQLPQISLAFFGNARQRRDIVDAVISEAPAIAPSQVMQLLEWFSVKENKKDTVDVLSNATVQAFDAGRIHDAFELANELCIVGQGESLPWAMLCKLARQAQSDDCYIQQNIVSTAVLHAPASEILDERNDRHWHIPLSSVGSTMYGIAADLVMRLLCEDFGHGNYEKQWQRVKSVLVDLVCGVQEPSFKELSQCLLHLRDNKCVSILPRTLERALEYVSDLESVMLSVPRLCSPQLHMLCGGDLNDVVSIVDDILGQDELISCSLLKSILKIIECPEISRNRSESHILSVYKMGLSPAAMQQAVSSLSQFLPPWSWRQTLAEVTLRDQVSASVTKGMLKCILFVRCMSEVDSVAIGDIDYSLPHHADGAFEDRVQVLASVGGANALKAAKQMQSLLASGLDLSLSQIMNICWQADYQSCLNMAIDTVHMFINPSTKEGHVFDCTSSLIDVMELLGLLPFCKDLPRFLWQATCLVCTQDNLFSDALSAIKQSGDDALRLLLTSQTQDSSAVSASSLIALLSKLRSNVMDANCIPHSTSVLTRACCAAASFLTSSNASIYRLMLDKYGDDPDVCTFIIFAMSGELVQNLHSQEHVPASILQIGIERIIHELPDRMHRAPLHDLQNAALSALCEALDHTASPSLLADVTVTITGNLDRMCDIAREKLDPAISRVSRLLSSTSADLTNAFKALARSLSVSIKQNFVEDPASVLLELLPLCGSAEMVAAAFNVMHAIQGRPAFDPTSCDDHFTAIREGSVLDIPGNKEHGLCWRKVLCHCLKVEQCAELALHAYATSGRLTLSADDENAVYSAAPSSHATTFRCLSLRPEIRLSAFSVLAGRDTTPFALAALALSSLSRNFEVPDSLPETDVIIDCLKSTDGCTVALHACGTTHAVPLSRPEIARLVACLLLKQVGLHCAALLLADCDCVPISRDFAVGRGGLSIVRKSIKEGIENGMLMIVRSHYRQVKDQMSRDSSV